PASFPCRHAPPPCGPPLAPAGYVEAASHAAAINARPVLTLSSRSPGPKAACMPSMLAGMGRSRRLSRGSRVCHRLRLPCRGACGTPQRLRPTRVSNPRRGRTEMVRTRRSDELLMAREPERDDDLRRARLAREVGVEDLSAGHPELLVRDAAEQV